MVNKWQSLEFRFSTGAHPVTNVPVRLNRMVLHIMVFFLLTQTSVRAKQTDLKTTAKSVYDLKRTSTNIPSKTKLPEDYILPVNEDEKIQDEKSSDKLEEETLDSTVKNKQFQEAREKNDDNFRSFSEGVASIDKFELVEGKTTNHTKTNPETVNPRKFEGDNFQSFSDGDASVDKFSLVGEKKNEDQVLELPLLRYIELNESLVHSESLLTRSKTFKNLLDRVKKAPWSKRIVVVLHTREYPAEYDHAREKIHIDLTRKPILQILDFAHQLYHGAHRYICRLYEDGVIDKKTFVDLFVWSEAGAIICELNVRNDLNDEPDPSIYFLVRSEEGKYLAEYPEALIFEGGEKKFLQRMYHAILRDDFKEKTPLKDYIETYYEHYKSNYDEIRKTALGWIKEAIKNGLPENRI